MSSRTRREPASWGSRTASSRATNGVGVGVARAAKSADQSSVTRNESTNDVLTVAAGLEDWVDFGVICGLLLLNAVVGFVQEYQAGSIVDELKK